MENSETISESYIAIQMNEDHPLASEERLNLHEKSNLEKYIDDMYVKHGQLRTDEVQIAKIEKVVMDIVSHITNRITTERKSDINRVLRHITNPFDHSILPVMREEMILKVGSFYEGTKNGEPDEFDFIFVFGRFKSRRCVLPEYNIDDAVIHEKIRYFLMDDRRTQYVGRRGPATTFRIDVDGRIIHVDLVPALIGSGKKYFVDIRPTEFVHEIHRTGSILLVNGNLSFTQTEVHFMKHVLSLKHRKVYRICKYLINGNTNYSELLRKKYCTVSLFGLTEKFISTYIIKLQIIFHHYECVNTDTTVGECVLVILRKLWNIMQRDTVHSLKGLMETPKFFKDNRRNQWLEQTIRHLKSLQTSTRDYSYEECRVTPLNKYLYNINDKNDEKAQRQTNCSNEIIVCCLNDKITAAVIAVFISIFFIILFFVL